MINKRNLILVVIFILIFTTACGLVNQALNQAEKIPSMAAKVATEVLTTVEAQITEVAPTVEAQVEKLPTTAAQAGKSFDDFSGVPEEVLQKALDRTTQLSSYRMDVTVTQGETVQSEMEYEVIPPEKIHGVINTGGMVVEMIVVGSQGYIKLGDNWIKSNVDVADVYQWAKQMSRDSLEDVKLIGPETIDGTPLMAFEYTSEVDDVNSTGKVWIGMLDGYIHRSENDSIINGKPYHTVTEIYDFDEPMTIEPPM